MHTWNISKDIDMNVLKLISPWYLHWLENTACDPTGILCGKVAIHLQVALVPMLEITQFHQWYFSQWSLKQFWPKDVMTIMTPDQHKSASILFLPRWDTFNDYLGAVPLKLVYGHSYTACLLTYGGDITILIKIISSATDRDILRSSGHSSERPWNGPGP